MLKGDHLWSLYTTHNVYAGREWRPALRPRARSLRRRGAHTRAPSGRGWSLTAAHSSPPAQVALPPAAAGGVAHSPPPGAPPVRQWGRQRQTCRLSGASVCGGLWQERCRSSGLVGTIGDELDGVGEKSPRSSARGASHPPMPCRLPAGQLWQPPRPADTRRSRHPPPCRR